MPPITSPGVGSQGGHRTIPARLLSAAGVALLLGLARCGGESPTSFPPLNYGYLPKLRLSVGTISIQDHAPPASGDHELSAEAPVPLDQALQQMAQDRLVVAGNSASAVFSIEQASIIGASGGAFAGSMTVRLDIITPGGSEAAFAEAHVSREFTPGSDAGDGRRARLYQVESQMMQDMNVEFEYQVKRALRDWLVDASGSPVAGTVQQQTLPPPGSPAAPVGSTPVGGTPMPVPDATQSAPGAAPSDATPPGLTPPGLTSPGVAVPEAAPPGGVPSPTTAAPEPGGAAPTPLAPPVRSPPPGYLSLPAVPAPQ